MACGISPRGASFVPRRRLDTGRRSSIACASIFRRASHPRLRRHCPTCAIDPLLDGVGSASRLAEGLPLHLSCSAIELGTDDLFSFPLQLTNHESWLRDILRRRWTLYV